MDQRLNPLNMLMVIEHYHKKHGCTEACEVMEGPLYHRLHSFAAPLPTPSLEQQATEDEKEF